jgi:hypothetical protein
MVQEWKQRDRGIGRVEGQGIGEGKGGMPWVSSPQPCDITLSSLGVLPQSLAQELSELTNAGTLG